MPTDIAIPTIVAIPAGEFVMGNDAGRPDERPAHRVRVGAFRAAIAPVTNAEYARFVVATGAEPPRFHDDPRFNAGRQPVVGVSWFEAVAYCEWLSSVTGDRYRLPTEAEREYAARAGIEAADWPWAPDRIDAHPLYEQIARLDQPHAPAAACANPFGLRCMAENVHEWCGDWYRDAWYAASPADAPAGPPGGERRASRGGSWRHAIRFTRVSARSSIPPSLRYNDYGFRVYADW